MRRLFAAALLLTAFGLPAAAQTATPPNYLIRSLSCGIESGQVVVRFDVNNLGGVAQETAVAATGLATGGVLAAQDVRPLGPGESQPVQLRFPSNVASGRLSLRSTVTLSEADSGAGPARVETASCTVQIAQVQPTAIPLPTAPPASGEIVLPGDIVLSTEAIAGAVIALCCVGLAVIGLVVLTARLLGRSGPVFPIWQPPYVPPAMLNPSTQAGARAGWQEHAASDALPSPCLPMDHAARKVLMGMEGIKLRNWRIAALRASQYDMYGRIGRTEVIATPRLVKHLNRQMDKAQFQPGKTPRSPETIVKALRPFAAWLANRLIQRIDRTPSLPIALDLRLTGDHGTVRILFELYTCTNGAWQITDAWEPEMMLRSGVIGENFSYTFYGRQADEPKRAFRRRLREEVAQRLGMMIAQPRPQPPPAADEPPPSSGSTAPSVPVLFDHPAPPPTQEIPRVPNAPGGNFEF
ncbi:MAG TPA: hypothetical protein VER79_05865 [Candidatus Limnocylindrales bacterium]|nr:hypothetical protein [Candidatus Limnocylindrales bacterium]